MRRTLIIPVPPHSSAHSRGRGRKEEDGVTSRHETTDPRQIQKTHRDGEMEQLI